MLDASLAAGQCAGNGAQHPDAVVPKAVDHGAGELRRPFDDEAIRLRGDARAHGSEQVDGRLNAVRFLHEELFRVADDGFAFGEAGQRQ